MCCSLCKFVFKTQLGLGSRSSGILGSSQVFCNGGFVLCIVWWWCVENLNTYTAICTGCGGHVMGKSVEWTDLLLRRGCGVYFSVVSAQMTGLCKQSDA